jgi:acetylornithine deacetylase/succinyl-diaminopimelate desuccinylase-like protein
MSEIKSYIESNKDKMLNELLDFLRIPSVSADPKHKGDVRKAAEWVRDQMQSSGLDAVEIFETAGHPMVYGEKILDPSKPTVLVYGHYDVQPPDPLNLWHSPPFEPVIKDEKIYARGACDDKGQLYMHLKAYDAMSQNGGIPCNLKFMFEGEEEVGSANLGTFVKKYKEKLNCDVVLISDMSKSKSQVRIATCIAECTVVRWRIHVMCFAP